MFLNIRILLKKTVIIPYVTETNMIASRHHIRKMLEQPFFGYSLAIFFTMQLPNVIKIPDEHWKMTKQSFQNVKGHMESVK